MHSYFILLLLTLTVALNSAKNIYQIDDGLEEQRESMDDYNRFEELLFKILQHEKNHPREYDRYETLMNKRAKAIVKGDPREFMG